MNHFKHSKPLNIILMIIGGLALVIVMAFLFGYFVMILWNWLIPGIFGLSKITYWQAWGLVLLCHILFKFNPLAHHKGHHGKKHFDREEFKEKLHERFNKHQNNEKEE